MNVMREYDKELCGLACLAEMVISNSCELQWVGDPWRTAEVDDASVAARGHIIELLGDGETLLFPVGDEIVQVVGAEHMLFEDSGLRLADIAAKAASGHDGAQRIYRELTVQHGIVVHIRKEAGGGATGAIEFPSDEGWITHRREQWRQALDVALDLAARNAERMLAEAGEIGMMLIPLDACLRPLEAIQVPLDRVPQTTDGRRQFMEFLACPGLKSAAGYIGVAEMWQAPAAWSGKPSDCPDRQEGVILQAETRAGDCSMRLYNIIRRAGEPPKFELGDQSRESPPGLFNGLLEAADAMPERRCVDEGLLQTALAAHGETIDTLGDGDLLMFAVGEDLVQVIGSGHTVRECTMLRLAEIKADAAAGDHQAQRLYYELTAGRGVLQRFERGADGREKVKMKFPAEEGWFAEVDAGLNRLSLDRETLY